MDGEGVTSQAASYVLKDADRVSARTFVMPVQNSIHKISARIDLAKYPASSTPCI